MLNDILFLKISLFCFFVYSIYISVKYRKIFDYNYKIIQELNKKEKYIEKLENIIRIK
jgi:hypothetical protein